MARETLQVSSALSQILPQLPSGTQLNVRRMDATVFPIIAYSPTSNTQSLVQLNDLAQYQLRPLLSSVTGVSRVQVLGGALEEYRVTVHPTKLPAYGMTPDDVAKALSAANVLTAVGRLEDLDKLYLGVSDARFQNGDEMPQTAV